MWLESLLFHTLPAPVGAFLEQHAKPVIGALPLLRAWLTYIGRHSNHADQKPHMLALACRGTCLLPGQQPLPSADWKHPQGTAPPRLPLPAPSRKHAACQENSIS